MPSLSHIQKCIKYISKKTSSEQSSYYFKWCMSHPLLEAHLRFLSLENTFNIVLEIVDVVSMFAGLKSEIHGIIRNQKHKHKRHSKQNTIEALVQIDQSNQTTRHATMYRRKPSGCKKIIPLKTLIFYPVNHQFRKLDDKNHQQRNINGIKDKVHGDFFEGINNQHLYNKKTTKFNL